MDILMEYAYCFQEQRNKLPNLPDNEVEIWEKSGLLMMKMNEKDNVSFCISF